MDKEKILEELKNSGFKITKPRVAIVETLLENSDGHLSVEELYDLVKEKNPDIGITTVYRTVMLLKELGILRKLDVDETRWRFEFSGNELHYHHHIVCTKCGKIVEFNEDLLDGLEEEIEKKFGFKITNHMLIFYGLCKECREKD